MTFARLNGITVHYREDGRRDGPAVVFANSLGTDFRIWDDVVERLSPDFRLVRYDTRGHGLSEATPAPYAMETLVEDLKALLDYLSVDDAVVVGLSVGGMIAQGLASAYPERVRALVLLDTAHKIGTADSWNARITAIEKGGIASISEPILERWFSPGYRSAENVDFAGYSLMLERTPAAGYVGTCAALRDTDLTQATAALRVPVLCAVGAEDGSTPPDLVRATAELARAERFEIIEGSGHLPCIEKPDETADLIRGFAEAHPARHA